MNTVRNTKIRIIIPAFSKFNIYYGRKRKKSISNKRPNIISIIKDTESIQLKQRKQHAESYRGRKVLGEFAEHKELQLHGSIK